MADNKNSRLAIQILAGALLTISLGLSSWTVLKAVELDKDLSTLKASNAIHHLNFEKYDDALFIEQRIISDKIDNINTTVTQIATKMGIE